MDFGDYSILKLLYIGIGAFAYFMVLFLTCRDLRIYRRTGYVSFRKGAFKGIIASTFALIGLFLILSLSGEGVLGLLVVFIALMVNQKGQREKVFTTAGTFKRFIGTTDVVRTPEEIKADYEKGQAEKKRLEKEKERADRNEKRREKWGKEDEDDEKS